MRDPDAVTVPVLLRDEVADTELHPEAVLECEGEVEMEGETLGVVDTE